MENLPAVAFYFGAVRQSGPKPSTRVDRLVIGKAVPDSAHKTYSAEQIAALGKLSIDMVHELTQFGLLDERGGRFGFRDLASARQIASCLRTACSYPKSFVP
jgi:hypothetical protein